MATSYLGQEGAFYAERQPTDYVDWSKIGKDLSDTLNAEAKKRTELKAQLDEENRKAINFLQESPQGEHKGASEWTLEYGSNGSQYMLMLNKKLKSGELSVKDYTVCVQNMMDGAKNIYGTMKDYQTKFKEKMDRYKKGESQSYELWINSKAEKYADFTKSQVYIDPLTGRNSIAIKDKKIINGKEVYVMSDNPTDVASIDVLRKDINSLYDKFNVDGATDAFVNSLGKEIAAIRAVGGASKSGQIMSKEDITSRQYIEGLDPKTQEIIYNFKKAETDQINSMLANSFDRMSVLTENLQFIDGKKVDFTYNLEEARKNKNMILMRTQGNSGQSFPDFENSPHGKEQMELSTEWVRQQARSKYDRVQNVQTYSEQRPEYRPFDRGAADYAKEKMDSKAVAGYWNQLRWGDEKQKQEAAEILLNTPQADKIGLIDIDLKSEPGKVKLRFDNPSRNNSITLATKSGKTWVGGDEKAFAAKGSFLHEITDREEAFKAGGRSGKFSSDWSNVRAFKEGGKTTTKPTNKVDIFSNTVKNINSQSLKEKSGKAAEQLQKTLLPLGIKVTPVKSSISNEIIVKLPNGREKVFDTNIYGDATSNKEELMNWLQTEMGNKPEVLNMGGGSGELD